MSHLACGLNFLIKAETTNESFRELSVSGAGNSFLKKIHSFEGCIVQLTNLFIIYCPVNKFVYCVYVLYIGVSSCVGLVRLGYPTFLQLPRDQEVFEIRGNQDLPKFMQSVDWLALNFLFSVSSANPAAFFFLEVYLGPYWNLNFPCSLEFHANVLCSKKIVFEVSTFLRRWIEYCWTFTLKETSISWSNICLRNQNLVLCKKCCSENRQKCKWSPETELSKDKTVL